MSDIPYGDTFAPLTPPTQGPQGGPRGGGPLTPQQAIQILSFRTPRTVGANSPIPAPLLNAPGGGAFGPAGGNLDQLLALLFGQRRPGQAGMPEMPGGGMMGLFGGMQGGVGSLPETPQARSPLPWEETGPIGQPAPRVSPGDEGGSPFPGGTAGPEPPAPRMPWDTPRERKV